MPKGGNEPLEARLEDFGSTVEALRVHHRRLAALLAHLTANKTVTDDESEEIEAEALLVEQSVHSIGERYCAIPPPPGLFQRRTECVFSDVERKTGPEYRRLHNSFSFLRQNALDTLKRLSQIATSGGTTSSTSGVTPAEGATTNASRPRNSNDGSGGSRPQKNTSGLPRTGKTSAKLHQKDLHPRSEANQEEDGAGGQPVLCFALESAEVVNVDEQIQREKERHMREIASEVEHIKELKEEMHTLLVQQNAGIEQMETHATDTAQGIEDGRNQLIKASRYKIAGAWIGGAILGGLIAGPVGMLAGAKTAGVVVGVAAGGSVVGGVVGKTFSRSVHSHNVDFDDVSHRRDKAPNLKEA